MKQVLSIAGLDSLAGGGMTADLKTFEEFGVFGHALLTCVVAIKDDLMFHDLPEPVIQAQLDSLRSVVSLDAIKIGLLHQTAIIELLRDFLQAFTGPIVLDPVLAFKEGDTAFNNSYQAGLISLFPYTALVTPNLLEAQHLSGQRITSLAEMKTAAKKIHALGAPNVLIKGGSRLTGETAYDLLYHSGQYTVFEAEKSTRPTTNGAGCTLSSAIAALLAKGTSLETAVQTAKAFVWAGIEEGLPLGTSGNINQLAYFRKDEYV